MDTSSVFEYKIETLNKCHDKNSFSCGIGSLDRYLQHQARQDIDRKFSVTHVLVERNGSTIVGYYTLSSTSIRLMDLPPALVKKLPKYPMVPTTLLARLALDRNCRGKKLGEWLLIDALRRSLYHSHEIGSVAVVVDAKDSTAVNFYKRYGFIQFPEHPDRLFLSMTSIEKLFSKNFSDCSVHN